MVSLCLVRNDDDRAVDDRLRFENVPAPPSPEQPPLAPNDPPFPSPRGLRELAHKQQIAVAIALQTHVLQTCPEHNEIFCDEDADPAAAFALAIDLVKRHAPYVSEFGADSHALTDLMTVVIAAAPSGCPYCSEQSLQWTRAASREHTPLHP